MRLIAVAVVFCVILGAVHLAQYSPVMLNYTSSLPVGLYWKTSDPTAPDVVFCLDAKASAVAEHLGIRLRGACPDGSMPELKPAYRATNDAPIVFTPQGFWVNGVLLPNTAPLDRSPSGKQLAHYPFGMYKSGIWAISSYSPLSFDSRYFGPVRQIGRAKPLLTM